VDGDAEVRVGGGRLQDRHVRVDASSIRAEMRDHAQSAGVRREPAVATTTRKPAASHP
jgi:hypothetical protein